MNAVRLATALVLASGATHAACTGDLPGRGTLDVYADASAPDAVIGGIAANQCGLEVTDHCANGRCLMFFDGLSGYIDVSALASGTIAPAPTAFEYAVTALDGSLSFMGQNQSFGLDGDQTIRVVPGADHVTLSLPAPLPDNIRMTSTGSSGWEALMPDWVGVPVPVSVYLDRVSAPRATLEMTADHALLKMDMRLTLSRVGDMPDLSASAPATSVVAPVAPETTVAPRTCDTLVADARPVLRGPDNDARRALLATMVSLGVTSIDPTNPKHCAEISAALGR